MKIKEHEVKSINLFLFALVAKCPKLNDEFTCRTASPKLNAKICWELYAGKWPKNMHYRSIPCLKTLVGSVR